MYIFPLLILKPKIYYKRSIFANDDQIWEDKEKWKSHSQLQSEKLIDLKLRKTEMNDTFIYEF